MYLFEMLTYCWRVRPVKLLIRSWQLTAVGSMALCKISKKYSPAQKFYQSVGSLFVFAFSLVFLRTGMVYVTRFHIARYSKHSSTNALSG